MYESMREPQSTFSPPVQMKADRVGAEQKPKLNNLYSGTPLKVSGKLANRIKDSFGIKASELALRESPEVARMGARATAQGNVIRFAPGEFRPDTAEGMEVLGHELNHVREQVTGGVHAAGGQVYQDAGHESRSDSAGAAFASDGISAASPVSVGGINASAAPVQGLFGFKKRKDSMAHLNALRAADNARRWGGVSENMVQDGKRKWDLAPGALKDKAFGNLSGAEKDSYTASRRRALAETFNQSGRGMRSEIADLFESGQTSLAKQGNAPAPGASTYQTMQAETGTIRTNGGLTGTREASDAYAMATNDVNARLANMLKSETEGKEFDQSAPTPEQKQEAERLALKVIEEYTREIENPESLVAGIADRSLDVMQNNFSFPHMEGGEDLAHGYMINDMIIKAFGPAMTTLVPERNNMFKNVLKTVSGASGSAMLEKDSSNPVAAKFIEMDARYRQSKQRQATIPPNEEAAPALVPAFDSIAPDMGKESAGRDAREAVGGMDALSEAAPEAAMPQSRAHSNTIFTTPTSHDSEADPEYVNLAQRSPERRKIEHIQAIMEGLKGKQPGQMGTHLPTLVALMEQFNSEHIPTSAQPKEKKPWYKRLFSR